MNDITKSYEVNLIAFVLLCKNVNKIKLLLINFLVWDS